VSPNCIDVERIAELASLPESHGARQHVRECPRCRSLWMSYQSFMEATAVPGANVEAARRDLEAAIRRRAAEAFPARVPPSARISFRERWAGLLRPAPVAAAAAVVVIAAALLWRASGPEPPVLRGGEAAAGFVLEAPEVSATAIRLAWTEVAGAEAYEVRLFGPDLNEIHRSGPVTATHVELDRSALPSLTPGTSLTWRVIALRGGDVVATSPPGSVTIP
jgi:hypothetical protein